jgi:major membrane immunogen (membrane-anchored lipoprotein)
MTDAKQMIKADALCFHMKIALEKGWMKATYENVDDKGWRYYINMKVEVDGEVAYPNIGYCPFCGRFLGVGVHATGACEIEGMNEQIRQYEEETVAGDIWEDGY